MEFDYAPYGIIGLETALSLAVTELVDKKVLSWGELIMFFEMATAYEGELLGVNAYDQPGVESYKNYVYYKLKKPGMPEDIVKEIRKSRLKKRTRYII